MFRFSLTTAARNKYRTLILNPYIAYGTHQQYEYIVKLHTE